MSYQRLDQLEQLLKELEQESSGIPQLGIIGKKHTRAAYEALREVHSHSSQEDLEDLEDLEAEDVYPDYKQWNIGFKSIVSIILICQLILGYMLYRFATCETGSDKINTTSPILDKP